jgi:predicted urease superfamily metal-dependent hydrolase
VARVSHGRPLSPERVLGLKTIPKLTKNLLAENIMSEKQAHMIHVENPQNTYAIELEH